MTLRAAIAALALAAALVTGAEPETAIYNIVVGGTGWRPITPAPWVEHGWIGDTLHLRILRLDPAASVGAWYLSLPASTQIREVVSPVPFALLVGHFTHVEHRFNCCVLTETPAGQRFKEGQIMIAVARRVPVFDACAEILGEGGRALVGPVESFFSAPTPDGPWAWHSVATVDPDCTRVVYDPLDGPARFFRHALPGARMRVVRGTP